MLAVKICSAKHKTTVRLAAAVPSLSWGGTDLEIKDEITRRKKTHTQSCTPNLKKNASSRNVSHVLRLCFAGVIYPA